MACFNPNQNLFPNTTNGFYCLNLMKNILVPKPNQAAKKCNEKETKQRMKTTWWESLQRSHKPLSAGWQTCDLLYHQWCSMVAFKKPILPSSIAEAGCQGWDHSHGILLHLLAPPFWIIFCFGSYFAHYTIFQCGMPDACQCWWISMGSSLIVSLCNCGQT